MKHLIIAISTLLMLAACAVSCEKKPTPEELEQQRIAALIEADQDYDTKIFLRKEYMDVYYYWYKDVKQHNATLMPYEYEDIYDWFNALLYKKDRWSWMQDAKSYLDHESGTISGTWGISFTQPSDYFNDYGIYVSYIYPGSPLEKYGVTRGAQLRALAGIEIGDRIDTQAKLDAVNKHYYDSPNTFTFRLTNGRDTTFTESLATSLNTNYILKSAIYDGDDFPGLKEKVGYFHLLSFQERAIPEMARIFKEFKRAGVKKLILDLRYNGGGSSTVSDTLASYIAPRNAQGKPYVTRTHNDLLAKGYNLTEYIKKNADGLNLDAIYFIMQSGSASASEMVYNGMRPYYGSNIHHVGKQTYGKPNGMYVLFYPGNNEDYSRYNSGNFNGLKYVFYPICFYNKNSAGQDIPSDASIGSGFMPENERPDDVYHDFGVQEGDIYACLTHIVDGTYPAVDDSHVVKATKAAGGMVATIALGPEQTDPHYGKFTVSLPKTLR